MDNQDDKLKKTLMWFSIVILLGYFFLAWVASGHTKELPLLVEMSELSQDLNRTRITVFGWVRSGEVKKGRYGSNFIELIIGEGDCEVPVLYNRPVYNVIDNHVIVQGKYRHSGKFGGMLQPGPFIVAEEIVRDWLVKGKETQE